MRSLEWDQLPEQLSLPERLCYGLEGVRHWTGEHHTLVSITRYSDCVVKSIEISVTLLQNHTVYVGSF